MLSYRDYLQDSTHDVCVSKNIYAVNDVSASG